MGGYRLVLLFTEHIRRHIDDHGLVIKWDVAPCDFGPKDRFPAFANGCSAHVILPEISGRSFEELGIVCPSDSAGPQCAPWKYP